MSNDIEQEIVEKGLITPRVTLNHIEGLILSEYYFTADQGVSGVNLRGTKIVPHESLQLLTFCVLVLENGFTVTGESACASFENFNDEIGRKIARKNAIDKIWVLEGYLLKNKLNNGGV